MEKITLGQILKCVRPEEIIAIQVYLARLREGYKVNPELIKTYSELEDEVTRYVQYIYTNLRKIKYELNLAYCEYKYWIYPYLGKSGETEMYRRASTGMEGGKKAAIDILHRIILRRELETFIQARIENSIPSETLFKNPEIQVELTKEYLKKYGHYLPLEFRKKDPLFLYFRIKDIIIRHCLYQAKLYEMARDHKTSIDNLPRVIKEALVRPIKIIKYNKTEFHFDFPYDMEEEYRESCQKWYKEYKKTTFREYRCSNESCGSQEFDEYAVTFIRKTYRPFMRSETKWQMKILCRKCKFESIVVLYSDGSGGEVVKSGQLWEWNMMEWRKDMIELQKEMAKLPVSKPKPLSSSEIRRLIRGYPKFPIT